MKLLIFVNQWQVSSELACTRARRGGILQYRSGPSLHMPYAFQTFVSAIQVSLQKATLLFIAITSAEKSHTRRIL